MSRRQPTTAEIICEAFTSLFVGLAIGAFLAFLVAQVVGCATVDKAWQTSGACVDLCNNHLSRENSSALWTPQVCHCHWEVDPITHDPTVDTTVDLKTLQCVDVTDQLPMRKTQPKTIDQPARQ
jgi:hypothetical protein